MCYSVRVYGKFGILFSSMYIRSRTDVLVSHHSWGLC